MMSIHHFFLASLHVWSVAPSISPAKRPLNLLMTSIRPYFQLPLVLRVKALRWRINCADSFLFVAFIVSSPCLLVNFVSCASAGIETATPLFPSTISVSYPHLVPSETLNNKLIRLAPFFKLSHCSYRKNKMPAGKKKQLLHIFLKINKPLFQGKISTTLRQPVWRPVWPVSSRKVALLLAWLCYAC